MSEKVSGVEPKVGRKRGRMPKAHQEFILKNVDKGVSWIAQELGRSEEAVRNFIDKNYIPLADVKAAADGDEVTERKLIARELRTSPDWAQLQKKFGPDEIVYFEHLYCEMMSQFRGDVLASERMMILELLETTILVDRNMQERKCAREDVGELERHKSAYLRKFGDDLEGMTEEQQSVLFNLTRSITACREIERVSTSEYVRLSERKESLMGKLKGTRDQRIKQIESSKQNWLGLVKWLQQKDVQETEGRQMELLKLAGQKEAQRLGRPRFYEDGTMDHPILSADTVDFDPEPGPDSRPTSTEALQEKPQ